MVQPRPARRDPARRAATSPCRGLPRGTHGSIHDPPEIVGRRGGFEGWARSMRGQS
jgi:hypothetical protein